MQNDLVKEVLVKRLIAASATQSLSDNEVKQKEQSKNRKVSCDDWLTAFTEIFWILFTGNTGHDDGILLAAIANLDAGIVELKVDDGKMTNDLEFLGVVIDYD